MQQKELKTHTFTLRANGIANVLYMPISIAIPNSSESYQTQGLFDTGASSSVITQKVVDALGLLPTGMILVNTASETGILAQTYLVDIYLKKDLRVESIKVNVGKIADGIDCLIGMDIINLGDFSITNFQGKTCLSLRFPSLHEIDYYKNPMMGAVTEPITHKKKIQRNDPCDCGSGKKYKQCHGKNS